MSVISTIETDAKAVGTDLSTELARLETLLEKAKTTIVAQAKTIAGHVTAAAASDTAVTSAAAALKAKLDSFEGVLTAAAPVAVGVTAAAIVVPLVVNTTANVANTVSPAVVLTPVAQTEPVVPAVNAVHVALDAAIHAGGVAPTLHNLNALEQAYAKLMANAGQSNSAAVPLPAHVAAIVQAAATTGSGVLHRIESDVETGATDVKNEVEKLASEVKTGVEDVAEGKVTIGPLHI